MDADARQKLREGAELIKRRAAELSSWSWHIPASLEIVEGEYEMTVRADPAIAPMARAFDLGLRHPLNYPSQGYKRHWANTPYRPFLQRAIAEQADAAAEKVAEVVDIWAAKRGFK